VTFSRQEASKNARNVILPISRRIRIPILRAAYQLKHEQEYVSHEAQDQPQATTSTFQ
jgi:hypothetical protein